MCEIVPGIKQFSKSVSFYPENLARIDPLPAVIVIQAEPEVVQLMGEFIAGSIYLAVNLRQ